MPRPAALTRHALLDHLRIRHALQLARRVGHVDGHQGLRGGEELVVVEEDRPAAAPVGHLAQQEVGGGVPEHRIEHEHNLVQQAVPLVGDTGDLGLFGGVVGCSLP
jgi:hypothetical protein